MCMSKQMSPIMCITSSWVPGLSSSLISPSPLFWAIYELLHEFAINMVWFLNPLCQLASVLRRWDCKKTVLLRLHEEAKIQEGLEPPKPLIPAPAPRLRPIPETFQVRLSMQFWPASEFLHMKFAKWSDDLPWAMSAKQIQAATPWRRKIAFCKSWTKKDICSEQKVFSKVECIRQAPDLNKI